MFQCSFLDNELRYIPTEVIVGCSSLYSIGSLPSGDYDAGLDVGRGVDLTCLIVVGLYKMSATSFMSSR